MEKREKIKHFLLFNQIYPWSHWTGICLKDINSAGKGDDKLVPDKLEVVLLMVVVIGLTFSQNGKCSWWWNTNTVFKDLL